MKQPQTKAAKLARICDRWDIAQDRAFGDTPQALWWVSAWAHAYNKYREGLR